MDISELIKQIEDIYNKFMISDNTPDMEADLKIKLLDAISSTLALCNLKKDPNSEILKVKINDLKEKLLVWDPYGPWFKENKELSDGTYDVIISAKTIKFEEEVMPLNIVKTEDFNVFKNSIQIELQKLKNEIDSIKVLLNNLRSMKPISVEMSKPAPKPIQVEKPISISQKVPIPKPVSVAQPIPISKPVPIPKPIPVTNEEPKPVPLTDIPPSSSSEREKVTSKLFGLLSKPTPESVQKTPVKPSPSGFKSVEPVQISKPIPQPVNIQPKPVKPVAMKSVTPKLVPIKPVKISVPELDSIVPKPAEVPESDDPETLYHELISLQGKRYGLERSIKDLKSLHQSGSITEDEYKQKLSSKLEDLKKISARIERIREKLD